MEPFKIDELAKRLLERVPPALRSARDDLEANFRVVLRSGLAKLDLVTRDEFDAQAKVRARASSSKRSKRVSASSNRASAADLLPAR